MDGRELKQYERWKQEVQDLRIENQHLRLELMAARPELYRAYQRLDRLEQRVGKLSAENAWLKQRVKDLTIAAGQTDDAAAPAAARFKPSILRRRRKTPGRKVGHAAALRPIPDHVDVHQEVALPRDEEGRESCPKCNACLLDLEDHERIVEDIIPAKVLVKCYHTRSGFCPCCRERVESRALEQPPAANIPHGQLGLNALATAVLLRIQHRLPFRQVARVLADLPELSVSPAAIARQVQRVARWFDGDYEKLMLQMRCAPQVYADETGWRTDGRNGWLWALTTPTQTLYHVDRSRGGKVIRKLLGRAFGGTLVSDFYSAYSQVDCPKQKCLAHLLRELTNSAEKSPAFASEPFYGRCKRLIKQMLLLKSRWATLGDEQRLPRVRRLEQRLAELAGGNYSEPNARRIARRMRRHQAELTAFLHEKDLEGTNNAAERAIRPAVVARKISGGSRSRKGATAWARLASLVRTAGQQNRNLLGTLKAMLTAAWASDKPPTMSTGP
jgi:transposase